MTAEQRATAITLFYTGWRTRDTDAAIDERIGPLLARMKARRAELRGAWAAGEADRLAFQEGVAEILGW